VAVSCGYDNEPWGSIEDGEMLDQLSNFYVINRDSAPWILFIYLFICGLFNDAVSSSDLMQSNGRIIVEY
jgi:hypothetical protein